MAHPEVSVEALPEDEAHLAEGPPEAEALSEVARSVVVELLPVDAEAFHLADEVVAQEAAASAEVVVEVESRCACLSSSSLFQHGIGVWEGYPSWNCAQLNLRWIG